MKNITISLEKYKEFDKISLFELDRLYCDLFDELELLSNVSSSFVENEKDLIQFAEDAGYSSVYSCALDLLTSYGGDRGRANLLRDLDLITYDDIVLYNNVVNASIDFLKRFLLSNAIWKAV